MKPQPILKSFASTLGGDDLVLELDRGAQGWTEGVFAKIIDTIEPGEGKCKMVL